MYSKTGVCRGIPIFLNFAPKHRLWVLVRIASAMFLAKIKKTSKNNFVLKIFNFYNLRKVCTLNERFPNANALLLRNFKFKCQQKVDTFKESNLSQIKIDF